MSQPISISFVPRPKVEPASFETPRARRKRELMAINPTCKGCGLHLTAAPLEDNSAHLVGDNLSCQNCVGDLKKANRTPIADIRPTLTEKGRARVNRFRYENQQDRLKAQLMAENPACSHCGKWLELAITENQAHLINDRLACRDHRKAVRETIKAESSV